MFALYQFVITNFELPIANWFNIKAEAATACAKHGNIKAEVATACAKHGNVKVEVLTGKAEAATDCAKHRNVNPGAIFFDAIAKFRN
nr:hypothetical protein [Nostoc sp. DedQUE07]MDZ8127955.1 hypothetical protein [Nostoc sp. DedQUE07]